jgi:hypothetical protein
MVNDVTGISWADRKRSIQLTLFTEDRLKLGDILEYRDELSHDGPDHFGFLLVWLKLEVRDIRKRDRG